MRLGLGRRRSLTREQVLSSIPVRNPKLEWKRTIDGKVIVVVRRRDDWLGKLVGVLFCVPEMKEVVLSDRIGSEVWEMCDGKHTIRKMVERIARRYKLTEREAEVSLVTFLNRMARRGMVFFLVPKEGGKKGGKRKDGEGSSPA
ncbi:MAG TPA: PqqD family protein [Armatimonadetes bacterium]|nr:PqqD family protein [Armatimonadota bacterium]